MYVNSCGSELQKENPAVKGAGLFHDFYEADFLLYVLLFAGLRFLSGFTSPFST